MAKQDKPKNPKTPEGSEKKTSPEDLDKTVIDIDIRQLRDGFDETVIVRAPAPEDSDLHDLEFFDEERTGDHEVDELEKEEILKGKALPKEPTEVLSDQKEKAARVREEKPKEEKRREAKPSVPVAPAVSDESIPVPEVSAPISDSPHPRPKFSLPYFALTLVFFVFLAEGLVEVLRQGPALRLPGIAALAFSGLGFVGAFLLRRWEGRTAFLGTVFAWFALVTYAGCRFYTSDPESLHFFKMPLETWMGPSLWIVSGIIAVLILRTRRLNFLPKILALVGWVLMTLAVVFASVDKLNLEDGLWGPAFLGKLPLFLRPGVLGLGLAFPLSVLAVLLALFFLPRSEGSLFRRGGWALLALSLLGSLLGMKLLARQGVEIPVLSRWVGGDFFGATLLDPATSPIRVEVFNVKPSFVKAGWMHLTVAASNSHGLAKGRQAWLMVKNQEGRSFASGSAKYLNLSRGDKGVKGVKGTVEATRLGKARNIALFINLPSLVETQVKSAATSAILELAAQLRGHDRLYLLGPAGSEDLSAGEEATWAKKAAKILAGGDGNAQDAANLAFKKIAGAKGLKQVILLTDADKVPPEEQRQAMAAEAKKQQAIFSILALGSVENPSEEIYLAPTVSALGFELLSAAAESLGDVSIAFPQLAPLPRLKWAKDASGKADIQGGKISFEVQAQDPSLLQSLQLKVDDEKPVDLDKTVLRQSLDLATLKIKPGAHRMLLQLTTQEGDLVSESLEVMYVAKRPLRFVKPLDKDSIAGNFNVMFSVGKVQGVETQAVDLLVDGNKVGQSTSAPFFIPLNSTSLSEGEHVLQAVETYSDGTTESAQIQVNVNQQVPQVQIQRPSIGEYLSNLAEIEAQVGGGLFEQVQKVEFLVDGEWIGEAPQAPFRLLWSNSAFPAGSYFVQARAYLNSQATSTDAVQVALGQGEIVVQQDPALSPTGMLFPDNVEVLIDASASMREPVVNSLKFDLAKAAMAGLLGTLPDNVKLNARALGSESLVGQNNCEDVRLLKSASAELDSLKAQGNFSLARALELLEKDMKKAQGSRVGLLIADGWDTCGGDPIAVATRLAKQSERLRLHVIYFSDVDPTTESLLKRLAEVMGGRTYKVARQEDLQQAVRDAVQVSFSLFDYKNSPVLEAPLSQNPFAVRAGEYRLEIDTSPPIVKNNVVIPTGGRKTFTVLNRDGKYELRED